MLLLRVLRLRPQQGLGRVDQVGQLVRVRCPALIQDVEHRGPRWGIDDELNELVERQAAGFIPRVMAGGEVAPYSTPMVFEDAESA